MSGLLESLTTGVTTVARAWVVKRRDGLELGFTDHDRDLTVDGHLCRAASGMAAGAVQASTGLAVDNSEVVGALSDDAIRAEDIRAGRWNEADVTAYLVDWQASDRFDILFRGNLGEISEGGGQFTAELRGLAERLNTVRGRVYHSRCDAILGDARCGIDVTLPGRTIEARIARIEEGGRQLWLDGEIDADAHWFVRGQVVFVDGNAEGLSEVIKGGRTGAGWPSAGAMGGTEGSANRRRFDPCNGWLRQGDVNLSGEILEHAEFSRFSSYPGRRLVIGRPVRWRAMSRVVAIARTWLGTPYAHGTSVRGAGTDCLGLVRGVWRDLFGEEPEAVPTYTADWSEPQGEECLMAAATRRLSPVASSQTMVEGEILLFRMREGSVAKHLGILSNAGGAPRFIHAYSGRGVVESSLSLPWARRIAGRFQFPTDGLKDGHTRSWRLGRGSRRQCWWLDHWPEWCCDWARGGQRYRSSDRPASTRWRL